MDPERSAGLWRGVCLGLVWLAAGGWSPAARAQQQANDATCMGTCHAVEDDIEHRSDPKHSRIGCLECHPNAKADEEHPDALSDFPPEQMCAQSGCHGDETKAWENGPHNESTCDACHGAVHGEFQRLDLKTCRGCHKEQVVPFAESAHAKEVECAECHGGTHSVALTKDPLSPMSKVMQIESCGDCHKDRKDIRLFRGSVHGIGVLRSGLDVAPSCATCHGSHDITKVDDPKSRVNQINLARTCGECHKFILASFEQSVHAEAMNAGKKAPTCNRCHASHGILDPLTGQNRLNMPERCDDCHHEEHETYRDSFHGKATRLGLGVAATCADCHTAHLMLSAKDPRSSVNPANVETTCGNCHQPMNAEFAKFDPHLDPTKGNGNPTLHVVWLFMTALLFGVFGFFTVHTFLWIQRAFVAWRRGELKKLPHEGEVYVRRFIPLHMWVHVTIVVTFLLLSATGLPLKFSYEGWAGTVAGFFGGLGGARWLHRVAGVLTFGYGLVFLGYLLREIVLRRRTDLLFGWTSMVPNKKDFIDMYQNVRWFLYAGERPKLDRWSYWEKFDFFAVFWGIPMIGLSGLVLWFPEETTRFLPGWMLNLAYIVHSDEALLATGFIFFFHFFHTHLRPEAFPLDPVMFTGRVPLERFKEERPTEYERLVRTGELEKRIVPPPTERNKAWASGFGYATLTIGVLLGIALIVTGLDAVWK